MKDLNKFTDQDSLFNPIIKMNYKNGTVEIEGESYMEDPFTYYKDVFDWLENFLKEGRNISFIFRLNYFNTSSSRIFSDMLVILKQFKQNGGTTSVKWYYDEEDTSLADEITDLKNATGVDIELIPFKS